MSLFRKPNRKFRQREATDSEDENGTLDTCSTKSKPPIFDVKPSGHERPLSTGFYKEEKHEPTKASKLLSFHDEEDEVAEVFKLKKSNYSRRLMKQREKERKRKEEYLNAEIACKSTFGSPNKKLETKSKEPWNVLCGNDAEDMEMGSDEDNEKVNPFKNVLQSGVIPDAATIYAMKKHRQMAREMGDFVPLEENDQEEEEKSRLVRDDDNDRSDDDDEPSRINFTINTAAVERQKLRETFLSLQDGSTNDLENEDAAELERWEREQIKKGVGVTQIAPLEEVSASEGPLYAFTQASSATSYPPGSEHRHRTAVQPFPTDLLNRKEVTLTTSDIKARLEERLQTLITVHETHLQEIEDCDRELIESVELLEKLTMEAPIRERNYELYQNVSGYVQDLVECMDVKLAHIDLLESRMMDLYKVRAQKLAARRQLDIRDQSDEYTLLANELLKGISAEYLNDKNNVDENRLRRAAEREGRRMRRRKLRERTGVNHVHKHQDGLSSDDEEADIDLIKFKESRQNILNEAGTIFEDVVEDFGTLEGVMVKFENWKSMQITSYVEAYVPLCLPKIFGIFVKLALLDWNPLEEERNFEESSWYHKLVKYGDFALEEEEDPDVNLLPGIMERIILPKITSYVQNVWNPLSSSETTKLINLIKDMLDTYPSIHGKSKQFQSFLKAIAVKINKALDDEVFIPLYPKELLENRSLSASTFFQRQFWVAVKLFQNILAWNEIIAEEPLQQMALGSLLNRYLLMALHTSIMLKDTLDKCKSIIGCFPKNWFKRAKGGSTLPLLKQFSGFLVKLADTNYSVGQKRSFGSEEAKEFIKEIVQLLVAMESLDDAVCVAKKYAVSGFKSSS